MAGKHISPKKRHWAPFVVVLAVAALVATIGGTMAWLTTHSEGLTNTFTPADIKGTIVEDFSDKTTKKDVKIQNDSDVPVYVRVALVPNWTKAETVENVTKYVPVAEPVGNDDVIIDNQNWGSFVPAANSNWVKGDDGYYYYKKPLAAANKTDDTDLTGNLFNKAEAKENDPYHMNLQVLLQMIQAEPASAVTQAWGVTVNADGTISK